ncbi:MAG: ASCH domain-containing protein [Muribaculaceae bacterium]|nr:ASCH domain-containing protein [Muribaculaceae bacterium]
MREIILPIKPVYAELILNGTKKVEYRKWIPSCGLPFKVMIYSSHPVKKVVGSFIVNEVIKATPEEIWMQTNEIGGIHKDSFFAYFENQTEAYAFKISDVVFYNPTRCLNEYGLTEAPQRFTYIK